MDSSPLLWESQCTDREGKKCRIRNGRSVCEGIGKRACCAFPHHQGRLGASNDNRTRLVNGHL